MHRLETYTPPTWAGVVQNLPRSRIRLALLPTPLAPWRPPGFPDDTELWIKRDDCTGISLSGNKVRKLEFLLADAVTRRSDLVLTCGGIQSNHARATAVAARELGMDSMLFLRTGNTRDDPGLAGNLLLDRLVGAEIRLITPAEYRDRHRLMACAADELAAKGRRPCVIPEGGSNGLGSWGYVEAVRELEAQCGTDRFDDIAFACGSGGTAAGLALGIHLSGFGARAHAVNVCDNAAYFHGRANEIFSELGVQARSEDLLDIMDGHVGRGYALSTDEELRFIVEVARATGVILDPVYTGKALLGLRRELTANRSRFRGRRILFLHTGGLFGLYDKTAALQPLLG